MKFHEDQPIANSIANFIARWKISIVDLLSSDTSLLIKTSISSSPSQLLKIWTMYWMNMTSSERPLDLDMQDFKFSSPPIQ
ncbi:hypothetical protein IEQ34_006610 [Dendrobium chrysotoxum]|uniref:Uncharacterized protein n=1 Tax=Dendrobium chrysotoxum TaxID=161865 RepID=A0AAV7H6Z9_DENCH|nr:hypothetical protein IEQ34_006610 [Dendrobium chrysotoxum]